MAGWLPFGTCLLVEGKSRGLGCKWSGMPQRTGSGHPCHGAFITDCSQMVVPVQDGALKCAVYRLILLGRGKASGWQSGMSLAPFLAVTLVLYLLCLYVLCSARHPVRGCSYQAQAAVRPWQPLDRKLRGASRENLKKKIATHASASTCRTSPPSC